MAVSTRNSPVSRGFWHLNLGTQDTPYWKVLNVIDIWNSSKVLNGSTYLGGSVTQETNVSGALSTLPNNVDYQTPIFNGFSAERCWYWIAMRRTRRWVPRTSQTTSISGASTSEYNQGPYFAGLTYIQLNGDSNVNLGNGRTVDLNLDNWGLGLGCKADQWLVGLIYEQGNFNDVNFERQVRVDGVPLATGSDARVGTSPASTPSATTPSGPPMARPTPASTASTIDNYRLGYQYNFSKRTWIGPSTAAGVPIPPSTAIRTWSPSAPGSCSDAQRVSNHYWLADTAPNLGRHPCSRSRLQE